MVTQEIEKNNLQWESLAGLASDGASVFTGNKNGVSVKLKQRQEEHMKEGSTGIMQQLWCVCHRLALACSSANNSVKFMLVVETNLRQLWSLFEHSNRKTALCVKVQMNLTSLNLNENTKKGVVRKIQKACRTRWLSLGKAVKSLKQDYPAVLQHSARHMMSIFGHANEQRLASYNKTTLKNCSDILSHALQKGQAPVARSKQTATACFPMASSTTTTVAAVDQIPAECSVHRIFSNGNTIFSLIRPASK
ncbi:hypothetical protein ACROYT_G015137 [Oculina patagonica]